MSKRILVVEDQEDNRQIIRDMLTFTDYEIMEAETGEQALEAVAKQRPDLILMDIQLPGMDGYETTRRIKADLALRSIPIIAVTSYALSGEEQKARAAGCDAYVPKPYSPRQLLAKIRQYLRKPSCYRRCSMSDTSRRTRRRMSAPQQSASPPRANSTACAFATTSAAECLPRQQRDRRAAPAPRLHARRFPTPDCRPSVALKLVSL